MKDKRQWYVYFLIHNRKIVYVGMSGSMQSRLCSHLQDKEFTSIRWIGCKSKAKAKRYEKRWILKFMPKYNKDFLLTLKRREMGIIKKYLPQHALEMLQNIQEETGTPLDELLRHPLTQALYEYEK